MAGNRTLKLSILADVDDLRKKLGQGETQVQGFAGKIGEFGKKAAAAFAVAAAAAGAYAVKLAVDGVKSAIEDEAAQAKLATTLRNVTGATEAQIAATEKSISAMQLQFGVADADLRPSLDRLVRSTKNVEEATKLQKIALDIAAGTGRDLQSVSEALGKAYDGNFGALKRLGVSIDEATMKSKDFDAVTAILSKTFEGQASVQADTFDGKMRRLNEAFAEGKETVGAFILDAITPLVEGFVSKVVPALSEVGAKFQNDFLPILKSVWDFLVKFFTPILEGIKSAYKSVRDALGENNDELSKYFTALKEVWGFIAKFFVPLISNTLKIAFEVLGKVLAVIINSFSTLANLVASTYNGIKQIIKLIAENPIVQNITGAIGGLFGGGKAAGGPVSAGTTYLVGEKGPELFTPARGGTIIPNGAGGGQTININVSGAIDPISTARQIAQILGYEATASGSFSNLGGSRVFA